MPYYRLLKHDLSKFSWKELPHYARQFCGDKSDQPSFMRAWLHHQNSNDHHWEYWINRSVYHKDKGDCDTIDMSDAAIREMIADWLAASRAYSGFWPASLDKWTWYQDKWNKIHLSSDTKQKVLDILITLF